MYKAISTVIKKNRKFFGLVSNDEMIVYLDLALLREKEILSLYDTNYFLASAIGHAFNLSQDIINDLTYSQKSTFSFVVKSNVHNARAFNTIQMMLALIK